MARGHSLRLMSCAPASYSGLRRDLGGAGHLRDAQEVVDGAEVVAGLLFGLALAIDRRRRYAR